jgi:hypothetical protein
MPRVGQEATVEGFGAVIAPEGFHGLQSRGIRKTARPANFGPNRAPGGCSVGFLSSNLSSEGPADEDAGRFRAGGSTLHPIKVNQGQSRLIKVDQGYKDGLFTQHGKREAPSGEEN